MKKTIICHSFPAWDTPYIKSTIELMKRLSEDHRIIFIDYHYTWKDLFTHPHAPKKRMLGIKSRWRKLNTKHGEIEVYNTPPVLPVNWINAKWLFQLIAGINGWVLRGSIRKILKQVSPDQTILVNALNPVNGVLTDATWQVAHKVYYCYDELSGTQWSNKWGPAYEKAYLKMVDQTVVTSPKLAVSKQINGKPCDWVPNGVNLSLFQNPPLLKTKNKLIGYVGAIDNRIDAQLVASLAETMSDYEFRFIGPMKSEEAHTLWQQIPNINCTGAMEQEALPHQISQMDCCLIPFVKNELTAAIYPLKINEYLAMGKPVVSTGFSDLSSFGTLTSLADGTDDFIKAIQREIKGNTRIRIQKRIAFAQKNSWEERAKQLSLALQSI